MYYLFRAVVWLGIFLSFLNLWSCYSSCQGCSARAARDQMLVAASFYMKPVVYAQFTLEVPHLSWFKTQRKGLGYEAWLYAMVRLAKCECCLQWAWCRLTHTGHAQYELGDGIAFGDYLKRSYPNLKSRCIGRAKNSKRQDWSCEASWNLFNLVGPIMQYTIETLQLGPNILRDSILTRIQDQRFEAFVHANAILWKIIFHELRALTNTTKISDAGLGVNPLEINDLMDHLWNVAVILRTEQALSVLDDAYRPWPKVRANEAASKRFYAKLERNRVEDLAELRLFETRVDVGTYRAKLLTILDLAGQAIHTSLERTMGKYLKATNGIFRNETRSDWEIEGVATLLAMNNAAERPFGIAKAYCDIYPSMNLRTLAGYSLSMANGSHQAPSTPGKQRRTAHVSVFGGGSALTSSAEVRNAVTELCGVRRVKAGKVTIFLDAVHATERIDAAGRRERKRVEGIEEQKEKMRTRARSLILPWKFHWQTIKKCLRHILKC
jgi:hypothetical protein